ncbi:MAG: sugar ABC transporter ATP-binding protein [Granulosicoccus sp.]|nr:sugar ABC transporter ATP-binding protein [Granulosicoccus sp.]
MTSPVLDVSAIEKSFGRNHVLRGVDLSIPAGSVTVLMGANGAGKSTLVKILCGYHPADQGRMTLAGDHYQPRDASDAINRGIVTVHQSIDDGVIPDLDVASNLMLDRLVQRGASLWVRNRQLRQDAQDVASSMELDIDLGARVGDLSVADRQMIAIARAMARAPRVLILDEPTSSLSAAEAERLFLLIDRLREQGVAILYISHRMSDLRRIADRIIVLRDGAVAGLFDSKPLDLESAVASMLGHRITESDISARTSESSIFQTRGLKLFDDSSPIDLSVGDGEVVAITGLLGSGKSRLSEILFGIRPALGGTIYLDGQLFEPTNLRQAKAQGVYLSPKDRAANAVLPAFDIINNMTAPFLDRFSRAGFISSKKQRVATDEMIQQVGVVCQSSRDPIGSLSGGNQQKVMIARWLLEPCRLLLLDEPFQGVDIGARRDIAKHIRDTARGRATIAFMTEIDEALEIADRVVVMNEGSLAGEHINGRDIDLASIVTQISGRAAL